MAKRPSLFLWNRAQALAEPLPPLHLRAERVAAALSPGRHGRRRSGPGDDFWQFRPYQPGEPVQSMDWRQSAKSDGLFLREKEWAASQTVWLWADSSPSMIWRSRPDLPEKLEQARLLALALAALLLRGGERVGALGLDRTSSALPRLQEDLEAAPAALPALLPPQSEAVLISDFLFPLDALKARLTAAPVRGHLLHLLDPAEEALPYQGRLRLAGLEGEGEMLLPRAEDYREAYAARLAEHRAALGRIAAQAGWSLTSASTIQPPETVLAALFPKLEGRC